MSSSLPKLLISPGRLPRYRRSINPPPMRLTERDLRVLGHLAEMRYLHMDQVRRLAFDGRATSNVKRRLTLAYHNGLVGRRLLRTDEPHGSPLALYYLERSGERALRDAGVSLVSPSKKARRTDAEPFFLRHLLETNDVWIAALISAAHNDLVLTWHDELELRRALTGVRIGSGRGAPFTLAPIPDGYVRVQQAGVHLSFAVELDRSHTEEARMKKKFGSYGIFHNTITGGGSRPGSPSRRTSLPASDLFSAGVRVLIVVSSRDAAAELARKRRLLRWCREESGGSLFWCATLGDVRCRDFFTAPIWEVPGLAGKHRLIAAGAPRLVTLSPPRIRP